MNSKSQQRMLDRYDGQMLSDLSAQYQGHGDFFNYGYWLPGTASQREASEALVHKLLSFIPEKTGSILDVACGLGASTRELLKRYSPSQVTAINLSRVQLDRAAENAPGCTFLLMDAAQLDFPDASFDNLICVESAFHFDTREEFLREAKRVLKPGGRIVLSDILYPKWARGLTGQFGVPIDNFLETPRDYERLLDKLGFGEVNVIDATRECRYGVRDNLRRWPGQERRAGRLSFKDYVAAQITSAWYRLYMRARCRYYVLVSARKP